MPGPPEGISTRAPGRRGVEQEGGNGLWIDTLRRLEDVVGATAAAALVRYAATEVAREAARRGGGADRAADWWTGSLGGRVEVGADGRDGLTLEVADPRYPHGAAAVSEALQASVQVEELPAALDPGARTRLPRIRAEARRARADTFNLHVLSAATRARLEPEPVDLSVLVDGIVADLREDEPRAEMEVDVEPGLVGTCDRALIRAALAALLRNAWEGTWALRRPLIRVGTRRGWTAWSSTSKATGRGSPFRSRPPCGPPGAGRTGDRPSVGRGPADHSSPWWAAPGPRRVRSRHHRRLHASPASRTSRSTFGHPPQGG